MSEVKGKRKPSLEESGDGRLFNPDNLHCLNPEGPCSTSDYSYILSAITSQYIQLYACLPAERIALLFQLTGHLIDPQERSFLPSARG